MEIKRGEWKICYMLFALLKTPGFCHIDTPGRPIYVHHVEVADQDTASECTVHAKVPNDDSRDNTARCSLI